MIDGLNRRDDSMQKRTAIIYVMPSANERSTKLQLETLIKFAEQKGLEIINTYIERVSGYSGTRPAQKKMLKEVHQILPDFLIVWKLDGLAVSTIELFERVSELISIDVDLISYLEDIDTTSPLGGYFYDLISIIREFEFLVRSEKVKAGIDKVKLKGKRIGRPPLPLDAVRKIRELRSGGHLIKEIELETGIAKRTIMKYLRPDQS